MFKFRTLALLSLSTMILGACSSLNPFGESDAPPLPGERISVLELQKNLEPEDVALDAQGFVSPDVWQNEFWAGRGGSSDHSMQQLAFTEGEFNRIWSSSIGQGATKRHPLSARPVIAAGQAFTLDRNAGLRAFNIETGNTNWTLSLLPKTEEEAVIGGGLAYADGVLYATNGFSELNAINPAAGTILWRTDLPAAARSAPTVLNNRIYVQLVDNQLFALNVTDGSPVWRYSGFASEAGLLGGSSPAVSQNLVVVGFSSGELTGINAENGAVIWSDSLANRRRVGALASLPDITALPVIDRDLVFAVGFGGRMLALDAGSGRRIWSRDIAGLETPWVAGNHVFVVTTDHKLVALGRETGAVSWVLDLKRIKRDDLEVWSGPLFAGNRLIVTSSAGQIIEVSPQDGSVIRTTRARGGVTIPPVIANGTLYILSDNGTLTAYR